MLKDFNLSDFNFIFKCLRAVLDSEEKKSPNTFFVKLILHDTVNNANDDRTSKRSDYDHA